MSVNVTYGFTILGKEFAFYGYLMAAGFLLGGFLALWRGKKYGVKKIDVLLAAIFAFLGGLFGAKLLAIFTEIPHLSSGKVTFMQVLQGGFVFYGGLIGGIAGLIISAKVFKLNVLKLFDIFAPSVPAGHAIGRLGCFFSGCCYGMQLPEGSTFAIIYPEIYAKLGTPTGVPLLPMQLMEMGILLILYAVLETLYYKTSRVGVSLFTYIISYGVIRFVLEFFRGDIVRGIAGGLSTSQWISLCLIVISLIAIFLIYFFPKLKRKEK